MPTKRTVRPTRKRTPAKAVGANNGLTAFAMHAYDASSAPLVRALRKEQGTRRAFALSAEAASNLDPETVARRHLEQALDSTSVPSFTTPKSDRTVEFKSLGTETVPLTDTKVVKFRQIIDKVPLYGSLVTVELDENNDLIGLNSSLGEPSGVSPVAKVSPAAALERVKKSPGYKKTLDKSVPQLSFYFDPKTSKWRLVYIIENVPVEQDRKGKAGRTKAKLEPPHFMDYVVDAQTSTMVAQLPRTPSMAPAVLQTAFDGMRVRRRFKVEKAGDKLVLRDPDSNVETYDFNFKDPSVPAAKLPGKAVTKPPTWSPAAVSAHANAVAVVEFLRSSLGRNNIDNKGGALISTINCVVAAESEQAQEWLNAYWDPELRQMVYGQAVADGGLRSLSVNIDIVAHEIFHGVTDRTARLEYARQPGALNESYSDIFGIIVSNLSEPDPRKWDWELGEGLVEGGKPFRDLSKPSRFQQPGHMRNFKVLPNTENGDWGGVHVNSGIHNKAAYNVLTAEDANGRLVFKPQEVAAVFYLALTQRLSRTSQFSDSRSAVIASARTLFRRLTPAAQAKRIAAIEKSFDAVGIT